MSEEKEDKIAGDVKLTIEDDGCKLEMDLKFTGKAPKSLSDFLSILQDESDNEIEHAAIKILLLDYLMDEKNGIKFDAVLKAAKNLLGQEIYKWLNKRKEEHDAQTPAAGEQDNPSPEKV